MIKAKNMSILIPDHFLELLGQRFDSEIILKKQRISLIFKDFFWSKDQTLKVGKMIENGIC